MRKSTIFANRMQRNNIEVKAVKRFFYIFFRIYHAYRTNLKMLEMRVCQRVGLEHKGQGTNVYSKPFGIFGLEKLWNNCERHRLEHSPM